MMIRCWPTALNSAFAQAHQPTVAVVERVDLGEQEHLECAAREAGGKGLVATEALMQGPTHQRGVDEQGAAGLVVFLLEVPGAFVGPGGVQDAVLVSEQVDQLGSAERHRAALRAVVGELESPDDVVSILGALRRR